MRRLSKNPYRFRSIVGLKMYFSEYLSLEEMEIILLDRTKSAQHLEGEPVEIAHLNFIASCAQAMELASELKMTGL